MKRRQTKSSKLVLSILSESEIALSHQIIQEKTDNALDKVTVYRILNRFVEDGLVHQVLGDDGINYYALCSDCDDQDHHHDHFHFRCTDCGKVECLDNEIKLTLPKKYKAQTINAVVSGSCANCYSA